MGECALGGGGGGLLGHMPAVDVRRVAAVPWFVYLAGVMGVVGVVVSVAVGIYLIRKYRERKWGRCTSSRRLEGKVREEFGFLYTNGSDFICGDVS